MIDLGNLPVNKFIVNFKICDNEVVLLFNNQTDEFLKIDKGIETKLDTASVSKFITILSILSTSCDTQYIKLSSSKYLASVQDQKPIYVSTKKGESFQCVLMEGSKEHLFEFDNPLHIISFKDMLIVSLDILTDNLRNNLIQNSTSSTNLIVPAAPAI